jgi:hypothetical protein
MSDDVHENAMEAARDACAAMGRHSEPFATARVLADAAVAAYLAARNEPTYPYQDGDTTVLGPEIFASSDGSVICWRGENYTPHELNP